MLAEWTGRVVGDLHMQGITMQQLAAEMGITNRYLAMIINGHRNPPDAEKRCREAIERIVEKRKLGGAEI